MSRGNASANTTAAALAHVRPIMFVEFQFDGGTLRLHNGIGTYVWNSQTWTGVGALGEISEIEESEDLAARRVTFRLNALDPTIIDELDSEPIYRRLAIVYQGYLNDSGNLVGTPDERWRGLLDNSEISLGGDNDSVLLHAENEQVLDTRSSGLLFTSEDQQDTTRGGYSGDTFFEYLDQMIDAEIGWGPDAERTYFGTRSRPDTVERDRRLVMDAMRR